MKLNKILYGTMALLLAGSSFTACTDDIAFGDASLDKAAGAEAPKDTVFSNAEYTRQFLVGIYSEQYYGLPYVNTDRLPHSTNPYAGKCDALTDCWHMGWNGAAVYGQYYTGALTANVTRQNDALDGPLFSYDHEHVWQAIRAGHIFLENADKAPGISAEELGRLKAECRCLIAARMWDLFQRYGGIPILDHALETNETTAQFPRNTVEECIEYMVKLLDEAIAEPNFPWITADPATMSGRWTRAGARALKAKILQMAASPIFNPKDGQPYYQGASEDVLPYIMYTDASKYQERWDRFYKACEEFFQDWNTNGYYQLTQAEGTGTKTIQQYRLAYRKGYALRSSKEIIHSVRHQGYDSYTSGRYCWHSWYTANIPRNLYWPTQEYVELFPWSDGTPFDWDKAYSYVYNEDGTMKYSSNGQPNYSARGLNCMFLRGTETSLSQNLINVQLTRDPRLYEECIVNGMQKNLDWTTGAMSGNIWELWAGGTDGLVGITTQTGMFGTGYGFNKYYMGDGTTGAGDNLRYQTQWVYLSLNEMYLMYAEALLQKSIPDIQKACEMVDIVRSRVGLGTLRQRVFGSKAYTSDAYTEVRNAGTIYESNALLDEILNERARELGLQDIRWFDMIRYRRTDWMTKQLHGLEMHRLKQNAKGEWVEVDEMWTNGDKPQDATSRQPRFFTYKKVDIFGNKRDQWGKDPQSNEIRRWLLSPFPQIEINKGYGLVQNPGWE